MILEALWDVVQRGGAVLAATHNPEALRYANRVVLFRDGLVEEEGTPQEATPHPDGRLNASDTVRAVSFLALAPPATRGWQSSRPRVAASQG